MRAPFVIIYRDREEGGVAAAGTHLREDCEGVVHAGRLKLLGNELLLAGARRRLGRHYY